MTNLTELERRAAAHGLMMPDEVTNLIGAFRHIARVYRERTGIDPWPAIRDQWSIVEGTGLDHV